MVWDKTRQKVSEASISTNMAGVVAYMIQEAIGRKIIV
jgi:hypothetical protein